MTRPNITLISPNKFPFIASWVGDVRSVSKKIGKFNIPNVNGAIGQDLKLSQIQYPLTFYFTGPAAALNATLFFKELEATGPWIIIHPELGSLKLLPEEISDEIKPVEDVQRRVFTTMWFKPIDEGAFASLSALLAIVDASVLISNASAIASFAANIRQATFGEIQALTGAINGAITTVKKLISIPGRDSPIQGIMDRTEATITAELAKRPIKANNLAAALQKYIQLPVLGFTNPTEAFNQYINLITANSTSGPSMPDTEGLNLVASQELTLVAAISAMSAASAIKGPQTRTEVIGLAEQVLSNFTDITDILDQIQTLYADIPIDNQYFSQSQSYTDTSIAVTNAARLLLTSALDLKVEKKIILKKDWSPVAFTVQEYGTLGESDANYHLFCDSNGLKGDEILVMPAGKIVTVQVGGV
jgi:prophage DNA circulation protein